MGQDQERRYLTYEGTSKDGAVFDVEVTGVRLVGAGLESDIRVQVLAGDNTLKAEPQEWADMIDPYGNVVKLSATRTYILLIQGGKYRLHPDDMAAATTAIVWLEDDTYLATERVNFVYDQFSGNPEAAAQAEAMQEAVGEVADATQEVADNTQNVADQTQAVAEAIDNNGAAARIILAAIEDALRNLTISGGGGTTYTLSWDDAQRELTLVDADGAASQPVTISGGEPKTYTLSWDDAQRELTLVDDDGTVSQPVTISGGNNVTDTNTTYTFTYDAPGHQLVVTPSDGSGPLYVVLPEQAEENSAVSAADWTGAVPATAGDASTQRQLNQFFDNAITVLTQRVDTLQSFILNPVLYVNTATGDDSNDGLTANTAFATFGAAAAYTKTKFVIGDIRVYYSGSGQRLRVSRDNWNIDNKIIFIGNRGDNTDPIINYGDGDYDDGIIIDGQFECDIVGFSFVRGSASARFSEAMEVLNGARVTMGGDIRVSGVGAFNSDVFKCQGFGSILHFGGSPYRTDPDQMIIDMSGRHASLFKARDGGGIGVRYMPIDFMQDFELRNSTEGYAAICAHGTLARVVFGGSGGGEVNEASFNQRGGTGRIIGRAWSALNDGLVQRGVHINTWPFTTVPDYTGTPINTVDGVVNWGGRYQDQAANDYRVGSSIKWAAGPGANEATITNVDGTTLVVTTP